MSGTILHRTFVGAAVVEEIARMVGTILHRPRGLAAGGEQMCPTCPQRTPRLPATRLASPWVNAPAACPPADVPVGERPRCLPSAGVEEVVRMSGTILHRTFVGAAVVEEIARMVGTILYRARDGPPAGSDGPACG